MNSIWHDSSERPKKIRGEDTKIWVVTVHSKNIYPGSYTIQGCYVEYASNDNTQWRAHTYDDNGEAGYYYPKDSMYGETIHKWAYIEDLEIPKLNE